MAWRIRFARIGGIIVAAVVLVMLGWVVVSKPPKASVQTLSDGTVVRVEGVTYDKPGQARRPRSVLEKAKIWLAGVLPQRWGSMIYQPQIPAMADFLPYPPVTHTNISSLHIWLRRDCTTNGPPGQRYFGSWQGELVDEQGRVFRSTQAVATVYPGMTRDMLTFESFPRREAKLQLRVYDKDNVHVTDFTVDNPGRGSKAGE